MIIGVILYNSTMPVYTQYWNLTIGNFAEFKTDAYIDSVSPVELIKAKCVCCLSYVDAKDVVDYVTSSSNVFTAICPSCSVPALISRSAIKDNDIKIGGFVHTHLAYFKLFHDERSIGRCIHVVKYMINGINHVVTVTIPNSKYGQTRMPQYIFKTVKHY
jgi:hypothetical protein